MATRTNTLVSRWWKGIRALPRGDRPPAYEFRVAACPDDIRAAQALRFAVFNVELQEGLPQSFATGLDSDPFDEVCDHLLVVDQHTQGVVGTYRVQTGRTAAARRGYYSEQEFDFKPFESLRAELLELGRACVHQDHRNFAVLNLLWKGLAAYAKSHGARYLIGCSSLTSQDSREGASMYAELQPKYLIKPEWRTLPLPAWACPLDQLAEPPGKVPKLLAAYLTLGARICGPPAIDREFKTIDFLTFLDLQSLSARTVERFLS